MKKTTLALLITFICSFALAQDKLDNEFYFRFGYSLPSWKQFGMEKDRWADGYKRNGFNGELGTIFMFNSILKQPNMAIGLDVDYLSFFWHRFHNTNNPARAEVGNLRINSKIGPSFTYSPVKKLAFDVFIKADINWMTVSVFVYNNDADDYIGYGNFLALGISTGFNIRYSILMIGFEFNTVSPKLENVDDAGDYLGNFNDSSSDKTPLPSFSFTIGLSF